jgi:tagatose 6-phosphate kinase
MASGFEQIRERTVIVTLTPNPALDLSHQVDALVPGTTHRVRTVHERAGGKGLNVSRVLHQLGCATLALAPVGGLVGEAFRAELAGSGVPHGLLPVRGGTRRTVAVVPADGAEPTLLNEPGVPLSDGEWAALLALLEVTLRQARVLVCSGSPAGPAERMADVVRSARAAKVPVIVDTTGEALLAAARAGADLLKPNAAELREATGIAEPVAAAGKLIAAGAGAVVVSRGPEGLLAVLPDRVVAVAPPRRVAGNPTGAGDAVVAALARGLAEEQGWEAMLQTAARWSAAAVAAPVAGELDLSVLEPRPSRS